MKNGWKMAMACLLVLALFTMPLLGCAEEEEEEVTITIGVLTDFTGPASSALIPLQWGIEDLVKYYNENDLLPGAKISLVSYDTKYDPARDVPGYDWCIDRGAQLIVTPMSSSAEAVKAFTDRDHVPLVCFGPTKPLVDPPGWTFCTGHFHDLVLKVVLEWLSQEHWDYTKGIPKVGYAGWTQPIEIEMRDGVKEYCDAHPDEFEWVFGELAPMSTLTWSGEVEKLKDCDYIVPPATGLGVATFIKQFQDRGYDATFFSSSSPVAYVDLVTDYCGWEAVDGMVSATWRWYDDPYPIIELMNELLYEYHPAEAEATRRAGVGYIGGVEQVYWVLDILREAVNQLSAENFDSQAYYDTALNYRTSVEGFPEWYYSETKRTLSNHVIIHEWSAEAEDLIALTDWKALS